MSDPVFAAFLERMHGAAAELSASSDLVEVAPFSPQHFLAVFRCNSLERDAHQEVVESTGECHVGIYFPSNYLRHVHADPLFILTWLHPHTIWHPNILSPRICIGPIRPGTSLTDLTYRVFDVITFQKVTMREDNALNFAACAWARNHLDRFPVDRRPLKRRTLDFAVETTGIKSTLEASSR